MHNQETWILAKVRDVLIEVFSGEWGNEPVAFSQNAKVLRSTDIDDNGHINYRSGAERNIAISILISKQLKKNDILLEVSGGGPTKPVGRVAFFNNPFDDIYLCSNFFRTLRASKAVHPKFLFWKLLLSYTQPKIWGLQQQTTGIINLKTTEYLKQTIMLPPLGEQFILSDILDTLDIQIQQTEQLIAKLKQMKAGLLHDLLTRGIDEHGDVRDPVAHPEEFKNSVLGSIPKGWMVGKFEALANIIDPQPSHRAPAEVVDGEPYIGVGDLSVDGSINFESCRKVSFEAVTKQEQRFSIKIGDIIFGKIGTIGFPQFLPQGIRYALNANTVIIKPKHYPSYVLWLLRSSLVEKQIQIQTHSTTQPAFGIQRIRAMFVPLPDKNEQYRISLILDSHYARITAEETELAKLKQLKKGLMHDLLTGRVRVTPLLAESDQLAVCPKSVSDCK